MYFYFYLEKRNRLGCPAVDVGKRLCRYRSTEGERPMVLTYIIYIDGFSILELIYHLNICHIRCGFDLEPDLRSSSCIWERSFSKERLVFKPIEDAHCRTCYFTFACQAN